MDIAALISEYGFPIAMSVGLGYFIYYIWWFVGEKLEPQIEKIHFALIKVIDQTRINQISLCYPLKFVTSKTQNTLTMSMPKQ